MTNIKVNLTTEQLALIKNVAYWQEQSVGDFIVKSATDAASKIFSETETITLSSEDCLKLIESIENPPEPTQALKKAAKNHKRLITSSDKDITDRPWKNRPLGSAFE